VIIGLDFDGTCVSHDYPFNKIEIGSVPVLRKFIKKGHKLVLNTMRGSQNDYLHQAIDWFNIHDIHLFGINKNPNQSVWTDSPKVYADIYIDDAALGCPLKFDKEVSTDPFVDWMVVDQMFDLMEKGKILFNKYFSIN